MQLKTHFVFGVYVVNICMNAQCGFYNHIKGEVVLFVCIQMYVCIKVECEYH